MAKSPKTPKAENLVDLIEDLEEEVVEAPVVEAPVVVPHSYFAVEFATKEFKRGLSARRIIALVESKFGVKLERAGKTFTVA